MFLKVSCCIYNSTLVKTKIKNIFNFSFFNLLLLLSFPPILQLSISFILSLSFIIIDSVIITTHTLLLFFFFSSMEKKCWGFMDPFDKVQRSCRHASMGSKKSWKNYSKDLEEWWWFWDLGNVNSCILKHNFL